MAAEKNRTRPHCDVKPRTVPVVRPDLEPGRASAIRLIRAKWVNGTVLHYHFLEGPKPQRDAVRNAFAEWKGLGIGLEFVEVDDRTRGRDPDRVRRRRFVVLRRPRRARDQRQRADDELRLGPHRRLRAVDRAARDRAHAGDAARAPEPVRRDRVGRGRRLPLLRRLAQQLAPRADVPQRAPQARQARGRGIEVGPQLGHGVLVPRRADRRAREVLRRAQPARRVVGVRQAVDEEVVPGAASDDAHAQALHVAAADARRRAAGRLHDRPGRDAEVPVRHLRGRRHRDGAVRGGRRRAALRDR